MLKNTLFLFICFVTYNLNAQVSEIETPVILPNLQEDNSASNFVVKQADGTLAQKTIDATSFLPVGAVVVSEIESDTNFINNGFQQIGSTIIDFGEEGALGNTFGSWRPTTLTNAPIARRNHTAIWTGTEMIIWGGLSSNVGQPTQYESTGAIYNPATNEWTAISEVNAPEERNLHSAIWTGTEMLVWGGVGPATYSNGKKYNPATNSWSNISSINRPTARHSHSAIWTGTEMIVWGGRVGNTLYNDGKKYNPSTNIWTSISDVDAPSIRKEHSTIWTGTEMIIWGGADNSFRLRSGARYNPTTDTWTETTTSGAPTRRSLHSAIWTGLEMIIWNGRDNSAPLNIFDDGRKYDPMTDSWSSISPLNSPQSRYNHNAIWTGTEMIIWGGQILINSPGYGQLNTGAKYEPASNSWISDIGNICSPIGRVGHSYIWTGTEFIVWGGITVQLENSGGIFDPSKPGFAPSEKKKLYLFKKL